MNGGSRLSFIALQAGRSRLFSRSYSRGAGSSLTGMTWARRPSMGILSLYPPQGPSDQTNQPTNQSPLSTNHFIIVLYTNILSLSWSLECQRRSFIFSLVFARGPLWDREGKLSHSLWRVTLFFLECFLIISPPKWVRCVLHSCTCIPGRAVAVRNGAAVLA